MEWHGNGEIDLIIYKNYNIHTPREKEKEQTEERQREGIRLSERELREEENKKSAEELSKRNNKSVRKRLRVIRRECRGPVSGKLGECQGPV